MKKTLFFLIFFLFPAIALGQVTPLPQITPAVVSDPGIIPELSSPRSVIDNFFLLMEDYAAGDLKALESALRFLDMSDIPEFSRKEQGPDLASKLYAILIRTKIERSKIIPKEQSDSYTLRSDEKGRIVIEKLGENWKFSKETVRNIPELYYQVKDEKVLRGSAAEVNVYSSIVDFRKHIPEFLTSKIFSIEYWQILSILLGLLIAWLARYICFYIFRYLTNLTVKKAEVLSRSKTVNRFVLPLAYLGAAYAFHFFISLLDLDPVVYAGILRFLQVIKIVAGFLLASRAIDLLVEILELRPKEVLGSDAIFIPLIRAAAKFVLFFSGIVLIAGLFSINVTGLLAGLGIGGLALALAAKDTVENLFGSITVLIDRPFKVGDFISIEGVSGSVESIGLRSTRLRTPENSLLTIPNSKLISVIVDNLGARKFFRTRISIGITYETKLETLQKFCESIRALLKEHPLARRDYLVNFNEFAASSLNILIQVYFQATSYADYLAKQEEFFINIIKIANELGVDFAYPVQRSISK
jgi:MscS family membrane protein